MVDRPLVATIGRMERRGVKVDRDYLAKLSRRRSPTEIATLEERRSTRRRDGPFTIGIAAAARRRCCTTGSA